MQAADWNQPDKHETRIIADGKLIERQLDGDAYFGDDRCSAWRNEYRHRRLMMNTEKNRYLTNGHNWQRPNLPCYLPGNGGLLYAIAMMAGGWKGVPSDSSWTVRSENFRSAA